METKLAFIILVYRNPEDLKLSVISIKEKVKHNYSIYVVESYSDDECSEQTIKICNDLKISYMSVPNKGYGYGNNEGIKYALETDQISHFVIMNPDTRIDKFEANRKVLDKNHLLAPLIKSHRTNYYQNPIQTFNLPIIERIYYEGFKRDSYLLRLLPRIIHKILNIISVALFRYFSKNSEIPIFASHGSFFIISKKAVESLGKIFDDNMFLNFEELLLAHRLRSVGIRTALTKSIEITHFEDSSMDKSDLNNSQIDSIARDSFLYYYEKLNK